MRLVAVFQDVHNPFDHWLRGVECVTIDTPQAIQKHDILIVWGGADIPPVLYGHKKSYMGGGRETVQGLDLLEWNCMQRAKALGCAIIGVCRGGQMLTALAGGHLIQHVDNHAGQNHEVECYDGTIINVNSYHHQMMIPQGAPGYKLLGWSKTQRSFRYFDQNGLVDDDKIKVEPEVIHYPNVRGLAIQWHPEWMAPDCPASEFCRRYFMENIL